MNLPAFSKSLLGSGLLFAAGALRAQPLTILVPEHPAPRVEYGAERLKDALQAAKLQAVIASSAPAGAGEIVVGTSEDSAVAHALDAAKADVQDRAPGKEGFFLEAHAGSALVAGQDASGVLYGCLELASRIRSGGALPSDLRMHDKPVMTIRGPCIGMQKTYILPGHKVYEYPYTNDLFPFFYDKAFWKDYLDFLADNRMNTLFLWSGHPFASLVKLKDYPYAVEVSPEQLARNQEMFRYIASEADKRGIWIVQQFYSIIVSKPFADHNHLETQLKAPTPLVADYTRKSIAEFVRAYPNVGLMACLGEALEGLDNQVYWFTQVILPGVKDGMAQAGLKEEPPVVLRTHATDATVVMPAALKVYHNLYTEEKFNGESLTTWEPRGTRQALHLAMSHLASTHMVNIHILANLEPFRYGDQLFIQKCVQAARDRLGARGVHLYPLSYWNWPDSPDKTAVPLLQYKRDWIWFEAWARYSWNPDIPLAEDHAYWVGRLAERYGLPAAPAILDAYNDSGECAPRILRRFGITEGNRQTMSLGMLLDELVNPDKYKPFPELWESQSPPGERLQEYVDNEWAHKPHVGETPPQIIREITDYSAKAVADIDRARPVVSGDVAEFNRIANDVLCIREMSLNYAAKANAALLVLRYQHSHDLADMDRAEVYLADSLVHFQNLADLTRDTYWYANSMQTSQRRIPVPGGTHGKAANYHWTQLVPLYTRELADFKKTVAELHKGGSAKAASAEVFKPVAFHVETPGVETYTVVAGTQLFTDTDDTVDSVAPSVSGLTGIRVSHSGDQAGGPKALTITTAAPARVLVGYFRSANASYLKVPSLETDAEAGDLVDPEVLVADPISSKALPPIDIYAWKVPAGTSTLDLHGRGTFVILGVVARHSE